MPQEVPLLDQQHWRVYPAALDPLPSHQPAQIACDPPGWQIELDRLEVSTGRCNYTLLEHPAQAAAPSGSSIAVELWHFDLAAPEPAQAHVAIFFGAALQWETYLDIPRAGALHQVRFAATRDLAVGDPIRFHLHNHGQNSWLLSSARALITLAP
ncbi:MAG: hypothetical protein ABW321_13655 [Polyangiales bacterium]